MIDAGDLTTWLVAQLQSVFVTDPGYTDVLVGDGIAPTAAGWNQGTPNDPNGTFVPYLVLTAGSPVTSSPGGQTLCSGVPVLMGISYVLTAYTHDRASADRLAARSRTHINALPTPDQLGDLIVRQAAFDVDSITLARRTDQTSPPMFAAATNLRTNVARAST